MASESTILIVLIELQRLNLTYLLEFLGDPPFIRVLDFLIENSIFDYTKKDIAENAEIWRASLYKIWNKLLKFDIVVKSRKIGNTTLYQLNKKTESLNS